MKFSIHGPFKLLKHGRVVSHLSGLKRKFWTDVDREVEGLSAACGCYVFAMRAGKGFKPWYIGKAERQCFAREVLSPHKLTAYNSIVANQKGSPILFLIAKRSKNKARFSKPITRKKGNRYICELEKLLIGAALERNRGLLNIRDSKLLRRMEVPGFINSGKGANNRSVRAFNKVIQ